MSEDIEHLYRQAMEPRFRGFRDALFQEPDLVRVYPELAFRERFIRESFDAKIGAEFKEIAGRPGDLRQNLMTDAYLKAAMPVNENEPELKTASPEEIQRLSAEIRGDEHAARVRDHGEADAATHEARLAEGAGTVRHLEPQPTPVNPAELEAAVSAMEQQWATQTYEVWHANDPLAAGPAGRVMELPEPQFPADYTRVAEVQARDVDHVYDLTNIHLSDEEAPWYDNPGVRLLAGKVRSSSVGDLFVDQAGVATRDEGFGFKEIGQVEKRGREGAALAGEAPVPDQPRQEGPGSEEERTHDGPGESKDQRFLEQLDGVRDTTRNLIESVMLDIHPRNAARIDFGLDSQEHYEALYYPIREGEIMPAQLDEALGHGQKLTELARGAPSNPHKEIRFSTSWDGIYGRPTAPGAMTEEQKLERTMRGLSEKADPLELARSRARQSAKEPGKSKGPEIDI